MEMHSKDLSNCSESLSIYRHGFDDLSCIFYVHIVCSSAQKKITSSSPSLEASETNCSQFLPIVNKKHHEHRLKTSN